MSQRSDAVSPPTASPEHSLRLNLSRSSVVVLSSFGLIALLLFMLGYRVYPFLHTILNTGVFLAAGVLALLLWDMGAGAGRPLLRPIAISLAVSSLFQFVHAIVEVEWFGVLEPIAHAEHWLRPATWPPAAYILPIGILCALWLRRGVLPPARLGLLLLVGGAALMPPFFLLPKYTEPIGLGVTRPTLLFVPLLWAVVAWACWRQRGADRLLPSLALMAAVLVGAHTAMVYSRETADTPAMAAHLVIVAAYLTLLFSLMRHAATDMLERSRAERELAQLNLILEQRVSERTAQLELANQSLQGQIAVRLRAERTLETQLSRLDLLNHITRAIGERLDLKSILQVVVRSLEDKLQIDFCCICLYDGHAEQLTVSCVGVHSAELALALAMGEQAVVGVDQNGLGRCVHGELVYEPDIALVAFPFAQRLAGGGLRALVVAPLLVESTVFGVLVTARRAEASFSGGDCEFLRQLSEHVALAAHQAQLHSALQQSFDELRRTQQIVLQQERLRALGQMASGIAHDINNAISPVALYTESLLETEPGLSARARAYLETIQRAIDDVAQTVARMREFYRQQEPQMRLAPVQLNLLVGQVLGLTRVRWQDMPQQSGVVIELATLLAPELPAVMGVESEIREALINLVFNAVDAMPEGGVLTLRTRVATLAGPDGKPAPRVCVEVADTGVGMDPDTRRRCLEPFFTTKGERGTGLGLAMVYGVAQRHKAEIEIDSWEGAGSVLRLLFAPVRVAEVAPAGAPAALAYALPPRLRLLVIDDDPVLLKSLRNILETDGHVVSTAHGGADGVAAFEAAQAGPTPFAAVVTDLGMPYVDGRQVAAAIKRCAPDTPVILLTGWGAQLIEDGDIPAHVDHVLSKPPKLRELRAALAGHDPRAAVQGEDHDDART
ncbi:signal transduction histidine kinase/ActR/RegA family two-component response regulator [Janthinobacterium sp. CG_23.3]|uniref:hybrid sensor histidine kinase/response regulator n=1 Tax=Janthinobacterium sp. CG_23.3 TaxID=3349634 RepID=UPI0038D3C70D